MVTVLFVTVGTKTPLFESENSERLILSPCIKQVMLDKIAICP